MMTTRLGLEGRRGLVAGGTSDVGGACVERLCTEGMTVAFTGSDRERGEMLARETGAAFLPCDPRDRASCDVAVTTALEAAGGRLDVLVTSSEMLIDGPIEATSEAGFRELIEANLTSAFRIGRAGLAAMRAGGGGSMVHIASAAGIRAAHEAAAFSVTSAGVIAVAELFAAEGAPDAVRSNAVCPGGMRGEGRWAADGLVTGADVASLVAWLASNESAHLTGATLRVDGGSGAAMLVDTRT